MQKANFFNKRSKPQIWIPILLFFLLIGIFLALSYFLNKSASPKEAQGLIYNNEGLGFSLILPKEFETFHTQRKDYPTYSDLEIFAASSDTKTSQDIIGYAKPVVVRIYDKDAWDNIKSTDIIKKEYLYQSIKDNRVYTIKFWSNVPTDWQGKWNEDMKKFIIENFKNI